LSQVAAFIVFEYWGFVGLFAASRLFKGSASREGLWLWVQTVKFVPLPDGGIDLVVVLGLVMDTCLVGLSCQSNFPTLRERVISSELYLLW
jgi:hypothetical protein